MYEKDYVLRISTLAARVLARLLGLKKTAQYQQALTLIDQTLQEEWGPSLDLVERLSAHELILMLKSGLGLDLERALLLAALLKELGDILAAENKAAESRKAYRKGLQVSLEALSEAEEATTREHLPLIETLADQIERSDMESDIRDALYENYQKAGETKRARDILLG